MADLTAMLQAAAGNAGGDANFIEDMFSCFLYTGNGSTQTINNGIDLAGEGGLVWFKRRNASSNHRLYDTARGMTAAVGGAPFLYSNDTAGNLGTGFAGSVVATSSGFDIAQGAIGDISDSGGTYVSWTFRKQPKFFDVVTYTGNGTPNRAIAHSLASAPGSIFIKRLDTARNWVVYHRSLTAFDFSLRLNTTDAQFQDNYFSAAPDATSFFIDKSPGGDLNVNASGGTYVAYLFAHNAGGFGLTGTDNVISCGSYTGTGAAGNAITLGYEPQWLLVKNATTGGQNWEMFDNMRGLPTGGASSELFPNTSGAERTAFNIFNVTATGFVTGTSALDETNASGSSYIYIAIRRGPMKVPTDGTSVFAPVRYTTSPEGFITGFPVDFGIAGNAAGTDKWYWQSRLQGAVTMSSASTAAEAGSGSAKFDMMNGYGTGFSAAYYANAFRRAPGFFDEVCSRGDGATQRALKHNLTVVPELMIAKARTSTAGWSVYVKNVTLPDGYFLTLNSNSSLSGPTAFTMWGTTEPTATDFYIGTGGGANNTNTSGIDYVFYLFASTPGVSKVGTFIGTGTTQVINCGFTAGARFVLIKSTSTTGDWFVWDSARGIVAGNDPYLRLNDTAAEVTNTDFVDTAATGFELSAASPNLVNTNGVSYIFLAIA